MKSEHRHELKEHDLGKFTRKAQGFFEKYGNQVLLGLVAVLVVIGGIIWWTRSADAKAAAGWSDFGAAMSAADFAAIADKYPRTEVAQWSRLREAQMSLATGLQLSFKNRAGAKDELEKARKNFETVLNETPLTDDLKERAEIGLATVLETTSGRDTAKAIKAYRQLLDDFPNSSYRELAEERIRALEKGGTQDFYAWFDSQNPTLEDRPKPKDMLPAGHPPIDFKPPETKTPGEKEDAAESEKPAKPEDASEGTKDEKPDAAKPESAAPDDKKSEKKPEPGEKPKTEGDAKPE